IAPRLRSCRPATALAGHPPRRGRGLPLLAPSPPRPPRPSLWPPSRLQTTATPPSSEAPFDGALTPRPIPLPGRSTASPPMQRWPQPRPLRSMLPGTVQANPPFSREPCGWPPRKRLLAGWFAGDQRLWDSGKLLLSQVSLWQAMCDEDESDLNMGTRAYPEGWYSDDDDGQLTWFNAGVRVGVGIGLGVCVGVGIGVGLLMSSY
uniref:Uncharacterized protein n=1 Tax=Aegilops tauschii subsp. strangulata TaxID=200361 RepID=A0A453RYR8_AEGTS